MRKEKQLLLDEMKGLIADRPEFLVTRYEKLTAEMASELRNTVAKTGGEVEVMPKRLLMKAASDNGVELDRQMLEGHIAVIFASSDVIETIKVVNGFSKDNGKCLTIVAGRTDGRLYGAAEVEILSKLPGRDQMRSELLATLQAPMSSTLSTMQALLASVPCCIQNKLDKEDAA